MFATHTCDHACENDVVKVITDINTNRVVDSLKLNEVAPMIVLKIIRFSIEPLFLTRDHISIAEFRDLKTEEAKSTFARAIFRNLPYVHRRTVLAFLAFLHDLTHKLDNSAAIYQSNEKLAITFAPYLVRPHNGLEPSSASQTNPFVLYCIINIEDLKHSVATILD